MKLDADEKELLESFERGEWKSTGGGKRESFDSGIESAGAEQFRRPSWAPDRAGDQATGF